ncbi:metallopeptidase family M24 containing protein [Aphelenchoides avenae]|nr:metallopeptidase family M24 containing protein [Aphelenchus avenae]
MTAGSLAARIALVTNVSTSLGYSIARRLGQAGAQLIVGDMNETKLKNAVEGLNAVGIKARGAVCDVRSKEQREELFKQIADKEKALDCLVLNPTENTTRGDIIAASPCELEQIYLNLLTVPFQLCQGALPLLEKSKQGSVVLVTSVAGYTSFQDIGLYSAASTGVLGMTKALSQSLARRRIRVNSVALGMMQEDSSGAFWNDPQTHHHMTSMIPLGRIAKNTECAATVEFLLSDRASYITGENCAITGASSEYSSRRVQLSELLCHDSAINSDKVVVVLNSRTRTFSAPDVPHVFRQCSYFRYLTGVTLPDCRLVVTPKKSVLFVREKSAHEELWDGPSASHSDLRSLSGCDEVLGVSEFNHYLASVARSDSTLAVHAEQFTNHETYFADVESTKFLMAFPTKVPVLDKIDQLRWRKSEAERNIAVIAGSRNVPNESHIVGQLEYEMRRRGTNGLAYPPVVASGKRANVIHYLDANADVAAGQCILVDAGCDLDGYVSDITRCFPVSGTFSPSQRALYDVLHSVQLQLLRYVDTVRPLKLNELYYHMLSTLAANLSSIPFFRKHLTDDELIRESDKLCPHHVSHYLGMDVHDTPTVSRTLEIPENVVITVEPGIYVREDNDLVREEFRGIGFRIEDDVLITDTGSEVLTKECARSATDIETLMSQT